MSRLGRGPDNISVSVNRDPVGFYICRSGNLGFSFWVPFSDSLSMAKPHEAIASGEVALPSGGAVVPPDPVFEINRGGSGGSCVMWPDHIVCGPSIVRNGRALVTEGEMAGNACIPSTPNNPKFTNIG